MNIPLDLQDGFGHTEMGLYVRVIAGGRIAAGDDIRMVE
jgi:MOSC domain-containing protein YiiM